MDVSAHTADDEVSAPESTAGGQPDVPADRDVARVDASQYPARDLPRLRDQRTAGFQAVLTRSALNDMHRHGRSSPEVEVCGVLVGNVYRDDHGPYLYVEACIEGDHAAGKTAQVTFTADTWTHINDEMERSFPGRRILGWYHTHPGFGIFLSEMDLFIQNNFFPEPWQAAYVYDPKSGEDGIFLWRQGRATRDAYLVDPDTADADPPRPRDEGAAPTANTLAELTARVQAMEQRLKWLVGALVLVAALAILSPLIASLFLPDGRDDGLTEGSRDAETMPDIPPSLLPPPGATTEPSPS